MTRGSGCDHHSAATAETEAADHLPGAWPNETSRVFISDASRADAQLQVERWQAWRSFTRSQWFPAPLTADQMQEQVEQDLRHSHPRALDLVVERIEVVRR